MMKATLLIIWIYIVHVKTAPKFPPRLRNYRLKTDLNFTETLLQMSVDIVQDTTRRISILQNMQKQNSECIAFEHGYLTYIVQDKYRRMVDLYNTSMFMKGKLYLVEHILHLQDIEHIYWEINHLTGMLHEIERKYIKDTKLHSTMKYSYNKFTSANPHLNSVQNEKGNSFSAWTMWSTIRTTQRTKRRTTRLMVNKYIMKGRYSTRKKRKPTWWPIEYDANNSLQILRTQDKIINELSWGTKLKILKDLPEKPHRRVGLSFLRTAEDTTIESKSTKSLSTTMKSEDSSMKMKLFRLMYETVRDSDLKAKRAELIKTHYSNYSTFEIGFILGDITDKFNIMTDIGLTLKRLYEEWKPMEHINAYEQIANKVLSPTLCQYKYRYIKDEATEFDKIKVKTLAHEAITESKYKIKQTDQIRDEYAPDIGFQVGAIMGYIREKYKTMLHLYKMQLNRHTKKVTILLPRIKLVRPIHYILKMEMIASLEVEIDRLVNMLETIPNATLGFHGRRYRRVGSDKWDSYEMSKYRKELFKKLKLNH